jgi:hypothetical protein
MPRSTIAELAFRDVGCLSAPRKTDPPRLAPCLGGLLHQGHECREAEPRARAGGGLSDRDIKLPVAIEQDGFRGPGAVEHARVTEFPRSKTGWQSHRPAYPPCAPP